MSEIDQARMMARNEDTLCASLRTQYNATTHPIARQFISAMIAAWEMHRAEAQAMIANGNGAGAKALVQSVMGAQAEIARNGYNIATQFDQTLAGRVNKLQRALEAGAQGAVDALDDVITVGAIGSGILLLAIVAVLVLKD